MKIALPFPPAWQVKQTADGRVVAVLPPASARTGAPPQPGASLQPGAPTQPGASPQLPDAIVTYGPLILKPDEPRVWADESVRADLPRGAKVTLGRTSDSTTRDGWPVRLVEAEVTAADGSPLELRLCALYTFLEHAAAVTVRTADRARFAAIERELFELLASARPDWRAQPLCVADAWDLQPSPATARAVPPTPPSARPALDDALARLSALPSPTARDHVERGLVLLSLARPDDALAAAHAALALDAQHEPAHYLAGVALGTLGRHADAIAAWTRALALAPRVDTHYNLGVAQFVLGDVAAALRSFEAARALDPVDVLLGRKLAQCLYALGRFDEGAAVRAELVRAYAASRDPRVKLVTEYVFDQHAEHGVRLQAVEPLVAPPREGDVTTLLAFRAVGPDDRPLGAAVLVETSEIARRAGTPYVLGVSTRGRYQVVATLAALPPYPALRTQAAELLARALAAPTHT